MLGRIRPTVDEDWHVGYASTLEVEWNHSIFGELGVPLLMAVEDTEEAVVALMIVIKKMMMRAMCLLSLSSQNSDHHRRHQ
jgi:hypothetical protein